MNRPEYLVAEYEADGGPDVPTPSDSEETDTTTDDTDASDGDYDDHDTRLEEYHTVKYNAKVYLRDTGVAGALIGQLSKDMRERLTVAKKEEFIGELAKLVIKYWDFS